MKYTLHTLPVLDAYKTGCECPLYRLHILCEDSYVDSMLSAACMEPDCRVKTNETGFCTRHFGQMFERRNRLGLAQGKDPARVEQQLWKVLPPEESSDFCHRIVLHGRAVCTARAPRCQQCTLAPFCPTFTGAAE